MSKITRASDNISKVVIFPIVALLNVPKDFKSFIQAFYKTEQF